MGSFGGRDSIPPGGSKHLKRTLSASVSSSVISESQGDANVELLLLLLLLQEGSIHEVEDDIVVDMVSGVCIIVVVNLSTIGESLSFLINVIFMGVVVLSIVPQCSLVLAMLMVCKLPEEDWTSRRTSNSKESICI
jgi:hypothetical protein